MSIPILGAHFTDNFNCMPATSMPLLEEFATLLVPHESSHSPTVGMNNGLRGRHGAGVKQEISIRTTLAICEIFIKALLVCN
jgi:hypothetical protein